jgi:hypothetical protein
MPDRRTCQKGRSNAEDRCMIGHGLIAPVMIPTTPPVDKRAGEGGEAGLSPIRLSRELGPEIDVFHIGLFSQ